MYNFMLHWAHGSRVAEANREPQSPWERGDPRGRIGKPPSPWTRGYTRGRSQQSCNRHRPGRAATRVRPWSSRVAEANNREPPSPIDIEFGFLLYHAAIHCIPSIPLFFILIAFLSKHFSEG